MFKKEVNRLKSKNLKLLVFIEHTAMFIEVRVIKYSTVVLLSNLGEFTVKCSYRYRSLTYLQVNKSLKLNLSYITTCTCTKTIFTKINKSQFTTYSDFYNKIK